MITEFVDYADVRAVLGVDDDELEDSTISLKVYEFGLMQDLRSVHPTLVQAYAALPAVSQRTSEQARFYESVRLFSVYAVAKQLCTSLPMFAPKEITDSKAASIRFSTGTFDATIRMINEQYDANRTVLANALEELGQTAPRVRAVRRLFASSSPVDPVTGS